MSEIDEGILKRRAFLRIRSTIPCKLICLAPDGGPPDGGWVEAQVVEIGGGGARIKTDASLEVGCVLSIRLAIPETHEIMRLPARVVYTGNKAETEEICVKFVGLSERERGPLIKFVFDEQLRRARIAPTYHGNQTGQVTDEDQGGN
jgi:c-di-GMP-binding flagellar brake protein YcgR